MSLSFHSMSILLLTFYVRRLDAIEVINTALTLSKENFTQTIDENELVFINFCIPWCGHCMALASEFDRAAEAVIQRYPDIKFANVDVSANDELAEEQKVHSYPTLRLFRNKIPVVYNSGPTAEDIIVWLYKQQESAVKDLKTIKELQHFQEENSIVIIGIFKDLQTTKEMAENFYAVADEMKDDYSFAVISEDEIIKTFDHATDSCILLLKNFDERKLLYNGPNDSKELKNFIELNSLPSIIEFEHATASKILRGPIKVYLLFFILKQDDQLDKYVMPLRDLALAYRDQILFVTITYDDADKKRVYEYFGIFKDETPSMRLIEFNEKDNEELIKYKPNSKQISLKTVDNFIQQYIEGSLIRYYKSQILPDNWNRNTVITLVGANFWTFVLDHDRITLVAFLAPWCGHCKLLEPLIENLAQKFMDNNEFFVAKIDVTLNEIESLKVSVFPTIKLFLKDNKEINYDGTRTIDGLEAFLAQYRIYYINKNEL